MDYFNNLSQSVKDLFRSLVGIREKEVKEQPTVIEQDMSRVNATELYRQFYVGSTYQIEQMVRKLRGIDDNNFYKCDAQDFQRLHNSIPADVVDTLKNIVVNDFVGITTDEEYQELLDKIIYENDFIDGMEEDIRDTEIGGDMAITINFKEGNPYPILKKYKTNEIEIIEEDGRFKELIVKHKKYINEKLFFIVEIYGYGYIKYQAYNEKGNELKREEFNQLDPDFPLEDQEFDSNLCLGIPLYFFKSAKYQGRGKSVFEGKEGAISFLDEVLSTYSEEVRNNKTIKGINEEVVPRNKNGLPMLHFTKLTNNFLTLANKAGGMGDKQGTADVVHIQSNLASEKYNMALLDAKLLLIQGLISPSTVGLDTKTQAESGVSQKEKEKQTRYTVNSIEKGLRNCYINLFKMSIYAYYMLNNKKIDINDINITVEFNQFNSSDWGQLAQEVGTAKQLGVISIYTAVKKLNKDWTEEEILEEVQRIKEESGMMIEDPFMINTDNTTDDEFLDLDKE